MALRVGIRFDRDQAGPLRDLAQRVRRGELRGDTATYEQAELAALTGEPLEVHCTDVDEAKLMVAGYILNGIKVAAVDTLTAR